MHLLYLTNKPVYPTVDGGCKAMQAMMELLLESNLPMSHFCISTEKHPFNLSDYPSKITEKCEVKQFNTKTRPTIFGFIKSFFKGDSYNISRFYNEELAAAIVSFTADKDVIVVLESIFLAPYLTHLTLQKNIRVFIRTHNIEHHLWQQKSKETKNFFKKWSYTYLANRLKNDEIAAFNLADELFPLTENDAESIHSLGITTKTTVIPIPFKTDGKITDYTQSNLFFIGAMNWEPNITAVQLLKESILPPLKTRFPELTLKLAGSFSEKTVPKEGIEHLGFVADLEAFFQHNGILVAPIVAGSGVRVKLLEAMSFGVPIVTTEMGALGIPLNDGLIVAKTTEELITEVAQLIASAEKRQVLGHNAQKFIQQHYSFSTVLTTLLERFNNK
ncbi:MAG: glycosyltransferase [Crocinitomicaceae bacterium]|nr:glycosyltransferase [Crocinitomicaceae bacterium]